MSVIPALDKEKSLKDKVISILVSEWPLSVKKIYSKVKNQGFSVSYQAVYKAIQELQADGVLEKEGKDYKLNIDWIERVGDFGKKLKESYENERVPTADDVVSNGMASVRFADLNRFYEFLVDFGIEVSKYQNEVAVCQLHHMYWHLGASNKIVNRFKKTFESYDNVYIVCPAKTLVDKTLAKLYENMSKSVHVKVGVGSAGDFDVVVSGDFVIQIFFSEELKKKIHDTYLKNVLNSVVLSKISYSIIGKKTEANVVIFKNPRLAEQIRNKVLSYFKEEKK